VAREAQEVDVVGLDVTGTLPAACVASVKNSTPFSWHSAPISRIGLSVPTSLLAHISATRIVSGAQRRARPFDTDAARSCRVAGR
jgi:hypothetical protein